MGSVLKINLALTPVPKLPPSNPPPSPQLKLFNIRLKMSSLLFPMQAILLHVRQQFHYMN